MRLTLLAIFVASVAKAQSLSVNTSNPLEVTIAKKGVNVCAGNSAGFCDSTWLSYPNLNAALFGIDKPSLNPVPSDFVSEPGVRSQIFQATYRDETGSMAQYDWLQTIDDLRCVGKFEEYFFSSFEDTLKTWDSFEQTGWNMQSNPSVDVSVSAEEDGVGAEVGTTIPPMFTRSSSQSSEASDMEKHFNDDQGSVAHSRADCAIYRAIINIDSPNLKFYSDFEFALLDIDAAMRKDTTENEKKEIGIWFVEKYGTHFSQDTQMGCSLAFETRYNRSETMNNGQNTLKKCNTVTGTKVLGWQEEPNSDTCTDSLNDTTQGEDTSVKRTTQTTIGSFPAKSGSISGWSEQLQEMAEEGTLTPAPIRRNLVPIVNLLETKAMMNIAHPSGPYKDQRLNLTNIKEVLVPAYNDYCAQMPGANCNVGCDKKLWLYHENVKYLLILQDFPYNTRAVYCTADFQCLYFAYGRWNFGEKDNFGRPENGLIETADCPQVGFRMLNMMQTGVSPIYGITSWIKCADICQNKKECQYWQWTPVQTHGSADTAACYIVSNFTGFTTEGYAPGSTADGIVTGARNCPLSTDTLTSLCPSKGANSLMWRYSKDTIGESFIPETTLKEVACEESTDPKDQFPVISGATWELVDDWDCAGNDIGSQSSEYWYGTPTDFQSRADCAKKCLEAANCVAFNFPKPKNGNKKCWWKHTNQESTKLGKTCGGSAPDRQYYTLLAKEPQTC